MKPGSIAYNVYHLEREGKAGAKKNVGAGKGMPSTKCGQR